MNEVHFKNKKLNIRKLSEFGFEEQNKVYSYSSDIADGQMKMLVTVTKDGRIYAKVSDTGSDEYILHLVSAAQGAFVGKVRAEYEQLLDRISNECFDTNVFKSVQSEKIISYVQSTYGDELEYLWQKFPDNAIVRRKDTGKWYAALLTISKKKLGFDSNEPIEILDLRMKCSDIETLVDSKKYFPGYHMNKKHWITICLDGSVSDEEIYLRIDRSYELAAK